MRRFVYDVRPSPLSFTPFFFPEALIKETPDRSKLLAPNLTSLIGFDQDGLSFLAFRLGDLGRHGDRDQAGFDSRDQPLLAAFEECDDMAHPASRASDLLGDLGIAVAAFGEIADLGHEIDRPVLPSRNVLDEAHHQAVGFVGVDHDGGDFC